MLPFARPSYWTLQKYFHGNYYQWSVAQLIQRLRSVNLMGVSQIGLSEYDAWTRAWVNNA